MSFSLDFDGGLTCSQQVGDLDRALNWYRDTLGFEMLYRVDAMGWAEMRTPVTKVNLGLSVVEDPKVEGGATLTFGVTDIEAAKKTLTDKQVSFDGDILVLEGMVKLLTFFDPDGNKLMLYEDLSSANG